MWAPTSQMADDFLKFSDRITCLPVIHGSGDFSLEVRRMMLDEHFDCVALPLPASFKKDVEAAVEQLPAITMVTQAEPIRFDTAGGGGDDDNDEPGTLSFVPVDPCQPVIAAVRGALQQRMTRAFIDLEVDRFVPYAARFPDPYALKKIPLAKFAAALLPALDRPPAGQPRRRIATMAARLRELEKKHQRILFVCSMLDWPWVRDAYTHDADPVEDDAVEETRTFQPNEKTLFFMLGELPFITGLYEKARADLDDDEDLSVDGVKELLITARDRYKRDLKKQARPITPQMLALYLRYVRNLSLIESRLTPDLYTLVIAAQQFAGDNFAVHVAETARDYGFHCNTSFPPISLGIEKGRLPDGGVVRLVNRLAGPVISWRGLELRRRPEQKQQRQWQMRWNPFQQCSWPPEDVAIEQFRTHTFDRAKQLLNQDLARSEKFTTSVMDGIDIRETLRNWHTGDIYVKNFPPSRGGLDAVVMLFDSPADPRDYPYRVTWHHEHDEESTLAFFASDYRKNLIGPGIAQATYGGTMMIFPPLHIPDIWRTREFDVVDTLEERLLMAAATYSRERHIALLSAGPPGAAWRRMAKQFGKKLIHLPLSAFSSSTVQQLRLFHVLNGRQIRSYAADFIRKA